MKLCQKGLHDKDLPGVRRGGGRCGQCRRANDAAHREERRASNHAYYAAHREQIAARDAAYIAAPAGRRVRSRSAYKGWKKRIAQRLVSKPQQIAALEAELERMFDHGTQD